MRGFKLRARCLRGGPHRAAAARRPPFATERTHSSLVIKLSFLREASMEAKDDHLRIVNSVLTEIEELKEEIDLVPEIITKQLNDSSFEFRPFTDEEKKQFVDSLDSRGKQILTELAGQARVQLSS